MASPRASSTARHVKFHHEALAFPPHSNLAAGTNHASTSSCVVKVTSSIIRPPLETCLAPRSIVGAGHIFWATPFQYHATSNPTRRRRHFHPTRTSLQEQVPRNLSAQRSAFNLLSKNVTQLALKVVESPRPHVLSYAAPSLRPPRCHETPSPASLVDQSKHRSLVSRENSGNEGTSPRDMPVPSRATHLCKSHGHRLARSPFSGTDDPLRGSGQSRPPIDHR